jgi:hypothetical protein
MLSDPIPNTQSENAYISHPIHVRMLYHYYQTKNKILCISFLVGVIIMGIVMTSAYSQIPIFWGEILYLANFAFYYLYLRYMNS